MDSKIRFVIVGAGNIAKTYISAIHNIPDAQITGIISRKSENQNKLFGFPSAKKLKELPTNSFDAIIICTPNGFHHLSALEAANLGKHVLCEKPLDITIDAMDNMISECESHNVKLGVAYQRRFSSDNPIVKSLIDNSKLGKIFSVNLSVMNYRDVSYYESDYYRGTFEIDGGGPFIQQASHYIDLYYWYFGRPSKIVSKLDTFLHNIEVEDHGAALFVHDSGLISTITASTATKPGFPAKMEIFSDRGFLVLNNDIITEFKIDGIENPSISQFQNTHTGSSSAVVTDTKNHELVILDFIKAILDDREPLVNGKSAKVTTEIVLDIYNNHF